MTTYKVLNLDGTPCHGGVGAWSLPTKRADGSWEPGEWREATGDLVMCGNGLHGCDGERQLVQWLGPLLVCEMEYDGEVVRGEDKVIGRRARLLRRIEAWNERTARLFACDCAERVLPIFERARPGDNRPRAAIETARRFANGAAAREELSAARAAAWAAAWAAARDAECDWQAERLRQYFTGEVTR